jgi:hypothetical protein
MLRLRREKGKSGGVAGWLDCRNSLMVRIFNQKREHDYPNRDQRQPEASIASFSASLTEQATDSERNNQRGNQHSEIDT